MAKKETTIDDLAQMVAKGFGNMQEYMDKRFETIDNRFESVDNRFESMDKRFESMDKRFESTDRHLTHINARLDIIEQDVKDIRQELPYMATVFETQGLDKRITRVEKKAKFV